MYLDMKSELIWRLHMTQHGKLGIFTGRPKMSNREELVQNAQLAEKEENYDDMAAFMKSVVEILAEIGAELSAEERNLLSAAYKNRVEERQSKLSTTVHDQEETEKAKEELCNICNEVLALLDEYLQARVIQKDEDRVFCLKMKGDYLKYLAEMASGEEKK